ncbi:VOC family protein [Paraburkholderia acidisoli]|uniref:Glyoxalase/bleomycin resistance/extradiol dioxygenase family protein n=1 Tax=Paraburkholderia acidisoli TaxID=2571748 RepID=A0A7Z2JKP8_9BURK|nr:VOC family protein [Paraburkholderia acidisoli]QGZ66504.1 glyoxalase/bleomycin resistance/extradiol dioxygenase family protein [Paraburkholderia acidisoli]
MHKHLFINLGVADLKRSMDFFGKLGFTFEPKFTNDMAACMVLGENIFAMLLTHDFMRGFTDKPLANAHETTEVLTCLSCESRAEVDGLVEKALAAGGTSKRPPIDCDDRMYGRSFEDPDGHIWELMYMSPEAVEKGAHG